MFKSPLIVALFLCAFTPLLNAQVGIGTTTPKALLHIVAPPGTLPEESGIILPKVSALPSDNLDDKEGMFVFLDSNNSNNKEKGIYFYNGSKWEKNDNAWRLGGNKIEDGEFIGTTNQKNLNFKVDNKQRLKIGVGGEFILRVPNGNELINIDKDANYTISNNNGDKLIEITKDGNYTINNANNNNLIEIKNNGIITLPYTELIDINSNKSIATKEYVDTNSKDQNASEVPYTNSDSGLSATNVQAAIDELASSGGGSGGSKSSFIEITGNLNGTDHDFGLTADNSREIIFINTSGSMQAQNIQTPGNNRDYNGKIITLLKDPLNKNINIQIQTGGNILGGAINVGFNFTSKRHVTLEFIEGYWYVIRSY